MDLVEESDPVGAIGRCLSFLYSVRRSRGGNVQLTLYVAVEISILVEESQSDSPEFNTERRPGIVLERSPAVLKKKNVVYINVYYRLLYFGIINIHFGSSRLCCAVS